LRGHGDFIMLLYERDRECRADETGPERRNGNVLPRVRAAKSMNDFYAVRARARSNGASASSVRFLDKLDPAVAERLQFLGAFLREPARVGAFVPSSPALAQAMLHGCALKDAKTVVEFGPGTGAFTRLILEGIGKQTAFLALELDEKHVRGLRQRFPRLSGKDSEISRPASAQESGLHHQRPALGEHGGESPGAHSGRRGSVARAGRNVHDVQLRSRLLAAPRPTVP